MVERGFGDNIALIGNGRTRTYRELTEWTNRIANALVDDFGKLVGINTLGDPDAENQGYAISMDYVKPIAVRLPMQTAFIALLVAYLGWTIGVLWG